MATPVRITRRGLMKGIAERWKEQRSCNGAWTLYRKEEERRIYEGLLALGPDANPDDADRVIGNGSWTSVPRCDGCGLDDDSARVRVGEEPNYESNTAYLCTGCVKEIAALMTSQNRGIPTEGK